MNNGYYENLDNNFILALNLYESDYTHEELLTFLRKGNIAQRQISALKLVTVNSESDAQILLSNLTGQDGKIREVVSLRLVEFMSDVYMRKYFSSSDNAQIFLDAVTDINGNICRNIIEAISNLRENGAFCDKFCSLLSELTLNLLDVVEKFDFQDGKYKVNKEAFKLYWCLETIYVFYDKLRFENLKNIVLRSKNIKEYTIREKAAKILSHNFDDKDLLKARQDLKNDSNYYVRRY